LIQLKVIVRNSQIKPEPTTKFDNSVTGLYALAGEGWRPIESSKVAVHYSVVERLKADPNYRPQNLAPLLNNLLPNLDIFKFDNAQVLMYTSH
jgi:hypothetical protein